MTEVVHVLERKGAENIFQYIRTLLFGTTVLEITQDDLFRALSNPAAIKVNDRINIQIMKRNNIDTILSFDKGFDKDKTIKREEP